MNADIIQISIQALVAAALRDQSFNTYREINVDWVDIESAMTVLYGSKENWPPHDRELLVGEVRDLIAREFQPWGCA